MPKTKKPGELGADWSETGTFLRRPPTGWLHEDRELTNSSAINYEVQYLGCVEVNQSMRTLQFSVRTQVTKEAILRLAELAGRLPSSKKRKVPKQISKLLGVGDVRWSGEMNLSISVENLAISNAAGMVIMNHSLPSISFASGGDGVTIDYIGYVAKDPMHGRACHVFECPASSQYVLTTIGQAFELRYKIYLNAPKPNPVQVPGGDVMDSNAWGSGDCSPPTAISQAGIYSDLPDLPASPPLGAVPDSRPRMYSNLPGFPTEEGCYENGPSKPRLENPYDTMHMTGRHDSVLSEPGVYSNPGEVTGAAVEDSGIYDNKLMTIRQMSTGDASDEIDCTPPMHRRGEIPTHEYGNLELDGSPKVKPKPTTRNKSRPLPNPLANGSHEPSIKSHDPSTRSHDPPVVDLLYDNQAVEAARRDRENVYDDPHYLGRVKRIVASTPSGTYDNPGEIMSSLNRVSRPESHYTDIVCKPSDEPDGAVYETPADPKPPPQLRTSVTGQSPKFDDTIYMAGRVKSKPPLEDVTPLKQALPPSDRKPSPPGKVDALSPLSRQAYFHGTISRIESEALLEEEGQFLIRESNKKPGQFVLTGIADQKAQHLLLMDRFGKVKSRDHEFESIPHLVQYFMDKSLPLVIGSSQVYLKVPILNAFLPS